MSFDTTAKILTDLVHHGFVIPIAKKVCEDLEKPEVLKNITTIVKMMDAFYASNEGIEQLDFLVSKLEKYLREKESFALLTNN